MIRPRELCIWHGPSVLVFDASGQMGLDHPYDGFWFRETRFLSRMALSINRVAPWTTAVGRPSHREALVALVFPELSEGGAGGTGIAGDERPRDADGIPWRAIDLMLRYRLEFHQLRVELTLANRSSEVVALEVAWSLDADFRDLLEANARERVGRGPVAQTGSAGAEGPLLRFTPRDADLPLVSGVAGTGQCLWRVGNRCLTAPIELGPGRTATMELTVTAFDSEPIPPRAEIQSRDQGAASWRRELCRLSGPGEEVPIAMVNRAMDDLGSLALLEGEPDEWLAPAAGMPLYPALFGRDAITATWQASMLDQGRQLDAVLTRLGRSQGARLDPSRDEEPGRIVHSIRRGPLARLGHNPFARYYADDASPFMFVIGLAQLYAWTGSEPFERHWDTARRILDWARDYGDRDGDGYVEYLTRAADGPKNQGWKDSGDGIVDERGAPLAPPIATCEVQGYWFAALQLAAAMSVARGRGADGKAYWHEARELKERFNRDWWMPEDRFIGLALDRDKRLSRSITSNPGHCLAAGIVNDEHVPRLIGRMFESDLWSGWGLRTLSSRHPSYNPVGYHVGSIWAVENATVALGLRRYGFDARALEIASAIFDLGRLHGDGRVPEAVGGYGRTEWPHPGAYPRANPIQAWNQSAMVLLLQVILGIEPVAPLDLLVVDPVLPSWLPEVTLEDLRVGGATVSIRFWRDARFQSHCEIVKKTGTLHLVRQPPPESLTTSLSQRVSRFVDGLVHA